MDNNDAPRLDGANLILSLITGVLTAVAFGIGCFFLVYSSEGFMGWTLFLLVPVATGLRPR